MSLLVILIAFSHQSRASDILSVLRDAGGTAWDSLKDAKPPSEKGDP
jgi:hypothetical protein